MLAKRISADLPFMMLMSLMTPYSLRAGSRMLDWTCVHALMLLLILTQVGIFLKIYMVCV